MRLSNNTKIKYLQVQDKLYEVRAISFYNMSIVAVGVGSSVVNALDDEIWDIKEFENYKIKLINNSGQAEIVDFGKWKQKMRAEL